MTNQEKVRIEAFEEALKAVESWRTKDHDEVLYRNSQKGRYSGFPAGIDAAEGAIANLIAKEKGELPWQNAAEYLPAESELKCDLCGQPKNDGGTHKKRQGYGDFESIECSWPDKSPVPPASTNSPAIPAKPIDPYYGNSECALCNRKLYGIKCFVLPISEVPGACRIVCEECANPKSSEVDAKEEVASNYVADREQLPEWVCFVNGRTVGIAWENGRPYLNVGWEQSGEKWLRAAAAAETDAGCINIGDPSESVDIAAEVEAKDKPTKEREQERFECKHCGNRIYPEWRHHGSNMKPCYGGLDSEAQPTDQPTQKEAQGDYLLGRCLPLLDTLAHYGNKQAKELRKEIVAYANAALSHKEKL